MSDPIQKIAPHLPLIPVEPKPRSESQRPTMVMEEMKIEVKRSKTAAVLIPASVPTAPAPLSATTASAPRPVELVIAFDRNALRYEQLFLAHLYRLMADIESKTGQPPRIAVITFAEDGSPKIDLPLTLMNNSGKTVLLAKLLEARTRNIADSVAPAAKKIFAQSGNKNAEQRVLYFGGEGVEKKLRLRPDETPATWQETIQNLSDWFQIYHAEMGETGLRYLEGKAADNRNWFFFRLAAARLKFPNTPLLHLIDAVRRDSLKRKQEGFLATISDPFFVDENCTEKNVPCDVVASSSLLYLDLLREIGSKEALGRFVVYGIQDYHPALVFSGDTLFTAWDWSNKLFTSWGKGNRRRRLAPLDSLLRYGDVPRPLLIDSLISAENARSFLVLKGSSKGLDPYFVDSRGIKKLLPAESLSEEEKQKIVLRIEAVFQQDITSGVIWCAVFRYLPEVRELFDKKMGPEIFSKLDSIAIHDWEPIVSSLVYNFELGNRIQSGIIYTSSNMQKLREIFFQIGLLRAQERFDWNEWEKRYEKLSNVEPDLLIDWMYQSIPRYPWFARLMMIPLRKLEPGLRANVLNTQKRISEKDWKNFPEEAQFIIDGQRYAAGRSWSSFFNLIMEVVERESGMSQKDEKREDPTWYEGDHSTVSKYLKELFWEERREEAQLGGVHYGLVDLAVNILRSEGGGTTNFLKREAIFTLIQRGRSGAFSYGEMKKIVENVMSEPLRLLQREDARKILKEMVEQYPQRFEKALMDTFEEIGMPQPERFLAFSPDLLLDVYLESLEGTLNIFELVADKKTDAEIAKIKMKFWAEKYTFLNRLLSSSNLKDSQVGQRKVDYFMARIRRIVPDAVVP